MDNHQTSSGRAPFWRWLLVGLAIALALTWLSLTPHGLLGKADAVGYAVCHRIDARSFHIGERAFPMCARCSGLFLGAMLGLVYQILQGRKGKMPPTLVLILLGLFALAWVMDGLNSFLMLTPGLSSFYQTENWTRLITGTGMGLGISAILLPSFIQTLFVNWEDAPALGNWKQVGGLILAAMALDAMILFEIPWLLYPLALISAAGVVVLLTMIYSMVLVMLFKKDNTYSSIKQLFVPLLGGFIIAILQIGAIDLLRYIWTGTWNGFNL